MTVDHVGSTAVPGLPAKPVIDIDLTIEDTVDELRYLPVLAGLGYRLVLREPWWYGHRMLLSPAEDTNLHVWPVGAPEPVRHLLFRDWLRTHPEDRELYATTKRHLAEATGQGPAEYSLAKNDVIDDIFRRIFSDNPSRHSFAPDRPSRRLPASQSPMHNCTYPPPPHQNSSSPAIALTR